MEIKSNCSTKRTVTYFLIQQLQFCSSRAAFTYEPFLSSKKSIATHHARQRSSILQHEIPHSRMLERPNELSQTPIFTEVRGVL